MDAGVIVTRPDTTEIVMEIVIGIVGVIAVPRRLHATTTTAAAAV